MGNKRKRQAKGLNLNEKDVRVLLDCEYDISKTKKLFDSKPHVALIKNSNIEEALVELKDFIITLSDHLLADYDKEEKEKDNKILCSVIALLKTILLFPEYYHSVQLIRIVSHLTSLLTIDIICHKVKNQISLLCEQFMEVSILDEHMQLGKIYLNYLLDITLCEDNVRKLDIKRVWTLRKFMDELDILSPECEVIHAKLVSTVKNQNYVKCKEGQHVIGHVMRRNEFFVKIFHKYIVKVLPTTSRALASNYGSVYFVAWNLSERGVQKVIEECIQDLIEKLVQISRASLDLPKAGGNVFALLSYLHSCRGQKNFSHVLNSLYSPVLWRNLRSDNPWLRCTSAEILFDVFPLENPFSTAPENAAYLERQIKEMKELLSDDSHFVRVIAIKGVCTNLAQSIELFSVKDVKEILNVLANDLTLDGSSYLVRKAVLEGFEFMISEPPGSEDGAPYPCSLVVERVLPCLRKTLYDENEKVRKAHVKMLLKLKSKSKFLETRFWTIHELKHILVQLAKEGPCVGRLLSKLIIDQLISKGKKDAGLIIARLGKMMDYKFDGVKKAFLYSQNALSVNDAYRLIVIFIGTIRKCFKDYQEMIKQQQEEERAKKSKKGSCTSSNKSLNNKRKRRMVSKEGDSNEESEGEKSSGLDKIEEEEEDDEEGTDDSDDSKEDNDNKDDDVHEDSSNEEEEEDKNSDKEKGDDEAEGSDDEKTTAKMKKTNKTSSNNKSEYMLKCAEFLSKHTLVSRLIQISTVIWVVFRKEISEKDEFLTILYNLASNTIPMLLKEYKGTPVYYATVNFASLIPIAKLRPVSTISSACISELKTVTEDTEGSKLECLIYSLCSWSRGHDVIELASEWLNFAFREEDLNDTAMIKAKGLKVSKVRFQQSAGKPLLGLKLLDVLFSDVINESRLVAKNYEQIYDFYTCLERIVIVIERKMSGAANVNKPGTNLTDEFMYRAYSRYLRLIHTLHRLDTSKATDAIPAFDAAAASIKAISWASSVLYPRIPLQEDQEPPLAAKCCLTVLNESTLCVALGETNDEHCRSLCLFIKDLLTLDGIWFLEDSLKGIKTIAEYAEYYTPDDEWRLISQILPCLLEKALSTITKIDVSVKSIKSTIKDLQGMKSALFSLPALLLRRYGEKSDLFYEAYRNLIYTCIILVSQEINYEDDVITHSKIEDLPCFAMIILKYIIVRPVYVKLLIPTILHYMKTFTEEGNSMLSCLSILYTIIIAAKKRFTDSHLELVIQTSRDILVSFKQKEKPVDNDESDAFTASSVHIDAKKAGERILEDIGKFLNCAILKPPANVENDGAGIILSQSNAIVENSPTSDSQSVSRDSSKISECIDTTDVETDVPHQMRVVAEVHRENDSKNVSTSSESNDNENMPPEDVELETPVDKVPENDEQYESIPPLYDKSDNIPDVRGGKSHKSKKTCKTKVQKK